MRGAESEYESAVFQGELSACLGVKYFSSEAACSSCFCKQRVLPERNLFRVVSHMVLLFF